ncbi:Uncharacterised protein [BD1-7 clade bacterium]|uniref:Photosystem I assembly protein Ycf3 n=1 Tax=BD1-7 clade bacterium TaxID=2029982 RepID=A0A5S9Q6T0_9GAMM|nr:Uncharacterised protein [BD1-7 clade bacterium]
MKISNIVLSLITAFCLSGCSDMTDWMEYSDSGWEKNNQEKYLEAEKLYDIAYEKIHFGFFLDKEGLAALTTNMAANYRALAKYEKAEKFYLEALELWGDTVGKEHENYATIANNISLFYEQSGQLDKALEMANESLRIRMSIYGEVSEDVVISHRALSSIYLEKNDLLNAIRHGEKALSLAQKGFNNKSEIVASSELSLGRAYRYSGDISNAIKHISKAASVYEIHFPNITRSGDTLNELALIQKNDGDYRNASENFNKAVNIYSKIYSYQHPYVAIVYENLANNYWDWGKGSDALLSIEKGLNISQNVYGETHKYTLKLKDICRQMSDISSITSTCGG